MGGSCVLLLSGCVTMESFSKISWSTIFTVVGSIGMGTGFSMSGAGELTTRALMDLFGELSTSPFFMCCLMMAITTAISNFMSNNAAVSITCPIAFSLAGAFGVSVVPYAVACGVGALLSIVTPLCNTNIAMSTMAGYRFRDYILWGLPLNVLSFLGCCTSLWMVFFR